MHEAKIIIVNECDEAAALERDDEALSCLARDAQMPRQVRDAWTAIRSVQEFERPALPFGQQPAFAELFERSIDHPGSAFDLDEELNAYASPDFVTHRR